MIAFLRRVWINFQIDLWYCVFQIHKAQYGDLNFGVDALKQERKDREFKARIVRDSRGPIHAGVVWE